VACYLTEFWAFAINGGVPPMEHPPRTGRVLCHARILRVGFAANMAKNISAFV
jgi:hypothetical protein